MDQSKLPLHYKETCAVLALLLPIFFLSLPLFSNTAQATEFLTQYRVYNKTFDTLAEAEDYMRNHTNDEGAQLLQRDPTRDVYSSSTGMPTKFAYAIPEKMATVSGDSVTAHVPHPLCNTVEASRGGPFTLLTKGVRNVGWKLQAIFATVCHRRNLP